jgi:hypothetical protein
LLYVPVRAWFFSFAPTNHPTVSRKSNTYPRSTPPSAFSPVLSSEFSSTSSSVSSCTRFPPSGS